MLVPAKPRADFSRGCALSVIRTAFLLSHPHHTAIGGGFMPASYMVILALANTYSLLRYLVARNRP